MAGPVGQQPPAIKQPPVNQQECYIAIWAKVVDTQMHFNEMSVKSRQLGLTFVAAALGVAVVLITRGSDFVFQIPKSSPVLQIHVSVILIVAAALALWAVRTLDLNVYHRMLRGAVTFGEDFEEHYMKQIFSLSKGMTQTISHYSRNLDANKTTDPITGKYNYTGSSSVAAENKIKSFYSRTFIFLFVSAFFVFIITNINIWFPQTSIETISNTVSIVEPDPTATTPDKTGAAEKATATQAISKTGGTDSE